MANTPEGTPYVESSDLVANYPAASLALANRVDLVGVLPFANAAARTTAIPTPTDGQFTYLQDTNSTEFYNGSAFQALAGGKILQVVRATDTTQRSTTSGSFVDVTGMSVTITPQKSTSAVLVFAFFLAIPEWSGSDGSRRALYRLTDSSNNSMSGAENGAFGPINLTGSGTRSIYGSLVLSGYATPATTSAVTYKLRFAADSGTTAYSDNGSQTGQMYALEISA